jgi:hypothetical protein
MVVSSTTSAAMAPEVGATLGKCGSGRRNVVTGRERVGRGVDEIFCCLDV